MGTFRVSMERKTVKYLGKTSNEGQETAYEMEAVVEGDEKIVAGTLRAMADKLDPPKTGRDY